MNSTNIGHHKLKYARSSGRAAQRSQREVTHPANSSSKRNLSSKSPFPCAPHQTHSRPPSFSPPRRRHVLRNSGYRASCRSVHSLLVFPDQRRPFLHPPLPHIILERLATRNLRYAQNLSSHPPGLPISSKSLNFLQTRLDLWRNTSAGATHRETLRTLETKAAVGTYLTVIRVRRG